MSKYIIVQKDPYSSVGLKDFSFENNEELKSLMEKLKLGDVPIFQMEEEKFQENLQSQLSKNSDKEYLVIKA